MSKPDPIAAKIQRICLGLDDVDEVIQFGHPFYKIRKKPFAVLSDGGLAIKVEKESQPVFLQDSRFTKSPYIGQHGWVTLNLTGKLDWKEITGLIQGSYQFVSSKRPTR